MQSDAVFKQLKNGYCKTFCIACKRNIFFAEKECRIIKLQIKIVAFREHGDSFNLTLMTLHHNIGNFFNVICSKLFHFLVSSLSLTFSIICLSLFLNAWDPSNCELRGYHCRKQVCIWNLFVPHFSFKLHFPVFFAGNRSLRAKEEAYLAHCQTSMMEFFVRRVHHHKPLTIFAKKFHHRC